MSKAQVVGEGERNGRPVNIYDNGMELYADNDRLAKPAPHTVITAQNSTVLLRRRQEKAAALLRERIRAAHSAGDMTPVRSSAEAFAESGALLYEEVVLNTEAYPRDRMEAWEKLGKYAQVLPADVRQTAEPAGNVQQIASGVAEAVLRVIADITAARASMPAAEVIDATAERSEASEPEHEQ